MSLRPSRKDIDYAIIAMMLVSGLYVTITGLVADLFGLHQFAYHRYAGYLCAASILVHLGLNWRRITTYVKRRIGHLEQQETPAPVRRERASATDRRVFIVSALSAVGGFVLGRLIPGRPTMELPGDATDIGDLYHRWSKPSGLPGLGTIPNWGERPAHYKTYPDAKRMTLPAPQSHQGLSLEEAVESRRSIRDYTTGPLSLEALSRLLYAAQGITAPQRGFRAAPSAGALYPIELYPVVHNVAKLEPGIYHYAVQEHALERIRRGDFRSAVTEAGLWQSFLGQANVCFVLSAVFQRTRWRYHERAYRYVLLEAGHIGQNLYLAATSMGLGACAVGAFLDDRLNDLIDLDGVEEAVLYIVSVGQTD